MIEEGETDIRKLTLTAVQVLQIHNVLTTHTSTYESNIKKLFFPFSDFYCFHVIRFCLKILFFRFSIMGSVFLLFLFISLFVLNTLFSPPLLTFLLCPTVIQLSSSSEGMRILEAFAFHLSHALTSHDVSTTMHCRTCG